MKIAPARQSRIGLPAGPFDFKQRRPVATGGRAGFGLVAARDKALARIMAMR